jgi:protein-S-isoprenylcysteine O-methyltransferase Ste14
MLARLLPLAGVLLFPLVNVFRARWQRRRHGSSGVLLFRTGSWAQRLRDAGHVGSLAAFLAQALVHAAWPGVLAVTSFVALPVGEPWQAMGGTLLFGGTLFMAAAQLGMGQSWRIGIDPSARPGLVTHGIYRYSRNPIYVGTFLCTSGFLVLVPTWISLTLLVLTITRVRWQVRQEEAYLIRTYGDAYRAYAREVGRFVPGLGRLT